MVHAYKRVQWNGNEEEDDHSGSTITYYSIRLWNKSEIVPSQKVLKNKTKLAESRQENCDRRISRATRAVLNKVEVEMSRRVPKKPRDDDGDDVTCIKGLSTTITKHFA